MGIFNRQSIDDGVKQYQATSGAVLLDVRTPGEFSSGHIPGAVNIPLDQIEGISIPKTTPLFVYCRSGARSSSAVAILAKMGYQAVNIGGIMNYTGEQE